MASRRLLTETSLDYYLVLSFSLEEGWTLQSFQETGKMEVEKRLICHRFLNSTIPSPVEKGRKFTVNLSVMLSGRLSSLREGGNFRAQVVPLISIGAMTVTRTIMAVSTSAIFECTLDFLER